MINYITISYVWCTKPLHLSWFCHVFLAGLPSHDSNLLFMWPRRGCHSNAVHPARRIAQRFWPTYAVCLRHFPPHTLAYWFGGRRPIVRWNSVNVGSYFLNFVLSRELTNSFLILSYLDKGFRPVGAHDFWMRFSMRVQWLCASLIPLRMVTSFLPWPLQAADIPTHEHYDSYTVALYTKHESILIQSHLSPLSLYLILRQLSAYIWHHYGIKAIL